MSSSGSDQEVDSESESKATDDDYVEDKTEAGQSDTWWDEVINSVYSENVQYWRKLLKRDTTQFRIRFKESFLEKSRIFLNRIFDFVEEDHIWGSIMETKSRMNESEEVSDDESLHAAIDIRRNKVFKVIDWESLQNSIQRDDGDPPLVDEYMKGEDSVEDEGTMDA